MKERPILFSAPMVRAILEGRKTQTRRICKDQNLHILHGMPWREKSIERIVDGVPKKIDKAPNGEPFVEMIFCPYGNVGSRLLVRETWRPKTHNFPTGWKYEYRATAEQDLTPTDGPWKPSLFMQRDACRIRLEITDILVERLNDISEADAIAEGIERRPDGNFKAYGTHEGKYELAVDSYASLWEKINGPVSWAQNPFVWVVKFKVV